MLRKIFTLIVVVITCFSCSKLNIDEAQTLDKEFVEYYKVWDFHNMKQYVDSIKIQDEASEDFRYEALLQERVDMRSRLDSMMSKIKEDIMKNDLQSLKDNLVDNLKGKAIYNELKDIDFSGFKAYTSKPKFNLNTAVNIVALNIGDDVYYFDVEYEYEKGKWVILDFRERR